MCNLITVTLYMVLNDVQVHGVPLIHGNYSLDMCGHLYHLLSFVITLAQKPQASLARIFNTVLLDHKPI